MNNYNIPRHYIFGKNSIFELGGILEPKLKEQGSFAIFVIDGYFENKPLVQKLPIRPQDLKFFADTANEPHADYINALVEEIRSQIGSRLPAAVIGIGGGSAMDIAKCVAILLTNPGKAEEYQGWNLVKNPAIYKIAVPTVSGTGAETTRTAVMTSKIQKLGINSEYTVCDQVVMDPGLLETVPREQFVWTAMDCYIHSVESLKGSMIDELSRAYAEKALQMVRSALLDGKTNHGKLMVASYFGGIAVASTNVGICHPLSYGLSLVLGLHHGIANCVALNQLDEYYPDAAKDLRLVLNKFGVSLPQNITAGLTEEQIDKMVAATLKNEKPLTNAFGENWREIFTPEKVRSIIQRM